MRERVQNRTKEKSTVAQAQTLRDPSVHITGFNLRDSVLIPSQCCIKSIRKGQKEKLQSSWESRQMAEKTWKNQIHFPGWEAQCAGL